MLGVCYCSLIILWLRFWQSSCIARFVGVCLYLECSKHGAYWQYPWQNHTWNPERTRARFNDWGKEHNPWPGFIWLSVEVCGASNLCGMFVLREVSAEIGGTVSRPKFKLRLSPKTANSFNSAFPAKHEINHQCGGQSEISSLYLESLSSHCNLAPVLLNKTKENDVLEITVYE